MQANSRSVGPKGKVRGFMSFFFLHIITFGIYNIFWWFNVAKEVNAFLGEERMSGAKMVFLSPITFGLYALIWQFGDGPKIIKEVQTKAGLPPKAPFMVGPWQFQRCLNKAWESMPA